MRTTRRRLLGLLGLGAAAAALGTGGKPAEAAGNVPLHAIYSSDNIQIGAYRVDSDHIGFTRSGREVARWDQDGNLVYIADETVNDAIAQARADGYERGYAVADARAQSRREQDDAAYIQGMIDQARASGGGVITLKNRTYTLDRPIDMRGCKNVVIGEPVAEFYDGNIDYVAVTPEWRQRIGNDTTA